ncbi:MAG: pyruvate formate lyase family protein, partial [Planctomycetota bacterium]
MSPEPPTGGVEALTPRVKRLQEKFVREDGRTPEWTLLMCESLRRTEDQPMVARRAEAFAHVLDNLPIDIDGDELLVGRFLKRAPTAEEQQALEEAARYMARPELNLYAAAEYAELTAAAEHGAFTVRPTYLHIAADARRLLELGWGGIARTIEERLQDNGLDEQQRRFLQAVRTTVRAASRFITRYAKLAAEKQRGEARDVRRDELRAIEAVCRRVAQEPARTFHDAAQLIWFQYFLMNAELGDVFNSSGPGQVDRYLADFYGRDLRDGRITREQASELIHHMFLAMNFPTPRDGILPVIIGGLDRNGSDASNELTEMCLEAAEALSLLHPSIAVRCHKGTSRRLLRIVPSLLRSGVGGEDACEWVHSVCTEVTAIGKTNAWIASPYFNMAMPLELVLNHGRSPMTGKQIAEDRGNLTNYRSFDELLDAYRTEMASQVALAVRLHRGIEELFRATRPQPFLSASIADCIANARDYT